MSFVPPPKRHPYHQWSPDTRALDVVGDKWTLLIVRDLLPGPRRFVELQRVLPGISTEQLRSRLKRMVADGLLTRRRYREVPPRVDYELTERARELAPVLGALARWGYDWAWSQPREEEAVDLGAVFRLAPGLAEAPDLHGRVEFVVDDGVQGEARAFCFESASRSTAVLERSADRPDARVIGPTSGWVSALSPLRDRSGLTFSGDSALAERLLDALTPGGLPGRPDVRAA